MDLPTIKPVLLSVVGSLAGVPCYWRDKPRNFLPADRAWCLLRLNVTGAKGEDGKAFPYDKRYDPLDPSYDPDLPPNEELTEVVQGVRMATLSVLCESLSQADDKTAYTYLENVRDGMSSMAAHAALQAVHVGVTKIHDTVDLTNPIDDRDRSIANLDLRLIVSVQKSYSKQTYIETIEVTGP